MARSINKHAFDVLLLFFSPFEHFAQELKAVLLSIPAFVPSAFKPKWCFNCCYLHLITCIPNLHYSWDERVDVHFISIHFRWHKHLYRSQNSHCRCSFCGIITSRSKRIHPCLVVFRLLCIENVQIIDIPIKHSQDRQFYSCSWKWMGKEKQHSPKSNSTD